MASSPSFLVGRDGAASAAFRASLKDRPSAPVVYDDDWPTRQHVPVHVPCSPDATFQIPRSTAGDDMPKPWIFAIAGFLVASITAGAMLLAMRPAKPPPPVVEAATSVVVAPPVALAPPPPVVIAPPISAGDLPPVATAQPAPPAPHRTAKKR